MHNASVVCIATHTHTHTRALTVELPMEVVGKLKAVLMEGSGGVGDGAEGLRREGHNSEPRPGTRSSEPRSKVNRNVTLKLKQRSIALSTQPTSIAQDYISAKHPAQTSTPLPHSQVASLLHTSPPPPPPPPTHKLRPCSSILCHMFQRDLKSLTSWLGSVSLPSPPPPPPPPPLLVVVGPLRAVQASLDTPRYTLSPSRGSNTTLPT